MIQSHHLRKNSYSFMKQEMIKKIKKGDTVKIRIGKDRGKTGKIIHVLQKEGKVIVEGLNLVKKHVRPKKQGDKGEVVQVPRAIFVSNVAFYCSNCGKGTRIGFRVEKNAKVRFCKKCNSTIS
jgi:large subunit ribosomal protein L24